MRHRVPARSCRTGRAAAAPPPRSPTCRQPTPPLLLPRQLLTGEDGARGQGAHLLIAHVARRPAEAAVGIDVELFGLAHGEHALDARGHVLRAFRVEALDVDDAGPQLAVLPVLLPQVELGELPPRELQDELVRARLEGAGKIGAIAPIETRAAEAIAEADVEGELGLHAL